MNEQLEHSDHLRHLRELQAILKTYFRDPISTLRLPLSLSWISILILQISAAVLSGAVLGILNRSLWDFATGVLILPVTSVLISGIFSAFLFYFFSLFHATFLDFRRLASIVSLSLLPYMLFHTVSGFLPPIDLLGFGLTCMLLVVGLIEQFGLEKKIVVRLVTGFGITFLIAWSISQFHSSGKANSDAPPIKSLDDLEHDVRK